MAADKKSQKSLSINGEAKKRTKSKQNIFFNKNSNSNITTKEESKLNFLPWVPLSLRVWIEEEFLFEEKLPAQQKNLKQMLKNRQKVTKEEASSSITHKNKEKIEEKNPSNAEGYSSAFANIQKKLSFPTSCSSTSSLTPSILENEENCKEEKEKSESVTSLELNHETNVVMEIILEELTQRKFSLSQKEKLYSKISQILKFKGDITLDYLASIFILNFEDNRKDKEEVIINRACYEIFCKILSC